MPVTKKKVETLTIEFKTEEEFKLEDLFTCSEIVGKELKVKGKKVTYKILEQNASVIVGIIETSRNDNIPPKKKHKTKVIERLGLDEGDGLAYANVFLFEKKRQILMYEVNKFGCFVDHFLQYIYKCCQESDTYKNFDIKLNPVLNANEYQRMLNMSFHKSIELQIANPSEIIEDYKHKNDAIFNVCSSGKTIGSTKVKAKFEVSARHDDSGLLSYPVKTIVDRALALFRGPKGNNMKKIIVVGYETDSDDNTLQPIDLIADRYLTYIKLDEPRENINLLEDQRLRQIKDLYSKSKKDFDKIFSKV